MKKRTTALLLVGTCALLLTGCGSSKIEATSRPFPAFTASDFTGNTLTNEMFDDYDATIVNFWSNGCGSCIEEMPELEEYYQEFKEKNINLIGVAASAGDSSEECELARTILEGKGVTYTNLIPDVKSDFYTEFVSGITTYPITYIVDSDGNMIGAPLMGVVSKQEDKLIKRIEGIVNN